MAPIATAQTIVISPDTRLVTIQNTPKMTKVEVPTPALPNYAVGLFDSVGQGSRKRKRLTHLTQEEKIMRRKLKNRVAAQTARDRKKVRMETLEETIAKVQQQASQLLEVNTRLLERTEKLERDNADLKKRLGLSCDDLSTTSDNRLEVERIKTEMEETVSHTNSPNSALPNVIIPDCVLSPDESADEFDNHRQPKQKVFDFKCLKEAKRVCFANIERASSRPAVSGVNVSGRNPQQQDAVNQTPIRSVIVMPMMQSLLQAPKLANAKMSLVCSKKAMPTLVRKPSLILETSPQVDALDLTMDSQTPQ